VVVAQDDGAVIAFSLVTGEEMWRHSLADLSLQLPSGTRPGSADGLLAIWDDKVVMTVSSTYVLALSLGDGSRCWEWRSESAGLFRTGYLYDGRYYTLDSLGGYAVVDAATGKLVLAVRLQVPAKTGVASVSLPILASETHFFTGSRQGPIVAFERDTGKFVWAGMPRRGSGTEAFSLEFATANGRLYYADMGFRLWCMEEVTPSDPGRQVKRKSGRK
jgi:outer membrane protein assembly factor BamB